MEFFKIQLGLLVLCFLAYLVIFIPMVFLTDGFKDNSSSNVVVIAAVFIVALLLVPACWISLASQVKRMRDTGHSPWWILLGLIPYVAIVLFLYQLFMPSKQDTSLEN